MRSCSARGGFGFVPKYTSYVKGFPSEFDILQLSSMLIGTPVAPSAGDGFDGTGSFKLVWHEATIITTTIGIINALIFSKTFIYLSPLVLF